MVNRKIYARYILVFFVGLTLAQDACAELVASDAIKGAIHRALEDINVGRATAFALEDTRLSRTLLEQSIYLVRIASALKEAFADGIYQACQELHQLMVTARVGFRQVQQNLRRLKEQLRTQGHSTEAVDKALNSLLMGVDRLLLLTR